MFKVGDWITNTSSGITFKYECSMLKPDPRCCESWQPKEDEWCLFIMNADESSLRQWTNSYNDNKQLKAGMCEPFIGELPSWIKDK